MPLAAPYFYIKKPTMQIKWPIPVIMTTLSWTRSAYWKSWSSGMSDMNRFSSSPTAAQINLKQLPERRPDGEQITAREARFCCLQNPVKTHCSMFKLTFLTKPRCSKVLHTLYFLFLRPSGNSKCLPTDSSL